jgi:hypothetical protein
MATDGFIEVRKGRQGRVSESICKRIWRTKEKTSVKKKPPSLFEAGFRKLGGANLHLGDGGMRGYDFPAFVNFLEMNGGISHHALLATRKRDRPPGEGGYLL